MDALIDAALLAATHATHAHRRRVRYTGIDYNPPTRSLTIYVDGRIAGWGDTVREARARLGEMATETLLS